MYHRRSTTGVLHNSLHNIIGPRRGLRGFRPDAIKNGAARESADAGANPLRSVVSTGRNARATVDGRSIRARIINKCIVCEIYADN